MMSHADPPSRRRISRFALIVALIGAIVQLLVSAYFLYMAHAQQPDHLSVGLVSAPEKAAPLTEQLEDGGGLEVTTYDDDAALQAAIREREVYGGLDATGELPRLYVASAAGPSVANLLRRQFTEVHQQQVADRVAAAERGGAPVPVPLLTSLTAPPDVVDVAPLPAEDNSGASLGFLVQALCLGGSVASMGLGRLGRMTRRSPLRGLGHAAILVVYALGSALVVLLSMASFGIGDGGDRLALFLEFALVSLAVTASTAAAVALVGPAGAGVGFAYFTVGMVISGASIAPEFLPSVGRVIGQYLPPGAGATAIRDSLYFPDAPVGHPLLVLATFAVVGLAVIVVTNARANLSQRVSAVVARIPD